MDATRDVRFQVKIVKIATRFQVKTVTRLQSKLVTKDVQILKKRSALRVRFQSKTATTHVRFQLRKMAPLVRFQSKTATKCVRFQQKGAAKDAEDSSFKKTRHKWQATLFVNCATTRYCTKMF